MSKSKTPKNGKNNTVETGVQIQGLCPVRLRRPFGSRPDFVIRTHARWHYSPRPKPKS